MKSMLKTALTVSTLFVLPGCIDFGWFNKKENQKNEIVEAAAPVQEEEQTHHGKKCSHKGCTHDHSKDTVKKHHKKYADEVETQGMHDEVDFEEEEEIDENQSMNADDNIDMEEEYEEEDQENQEEEENN